MSVTDIRSRNAVVTELLPKVIGMLVNLFRRRGVQDGDLDDAIGEVLASWVDKCDPSRTPPEIMQYVKKIAYTFCRKLQKQQARRPWQLATETGSNIADDDRDPFARSEELEALGAALDRLPQRAREAITLLYLEDQSYPEVAARMAISVETARNLVCLGRRLLRDLLQKEGHQ